MSSSGSFRRTPQEKGHRGLSLSGATHLVFQPISFLSPMLKRLVLPAHLLPVKAHRSIRVIGNYFNGLRGCVYVGVLIPDTVSVALPLCNRRWRMRLLRRSHVVLPLRGSWRGCWTLPQLHRRRRQFINGPFELAALLRSTSPTTSTPSIFPSPLEIEPENPHFRAQTPYGLSYRRPHVACFALNAISLRVVYQTFCGDLSGYARITDWECKLHKGGVGTKTYSVCQTAFLCMGLRWRRGCELH